MQHGINDRLSIIEETSDGFLEIDEGKLNIFDTYDEPIPEWEPSREITPYNKLSIVHCDIETTGGIVSGSRDIDYKNHSIVLIGVKNERGDSKILSAKGREKKAIQDFFRILAFKKPDILNFYNGFFFDIPFIIGRCKVLGIPHPFWIQPCSLKDIERSHGSFNEYSKKISNFKLLKGELHDSNLFPALKVRRTAQINSVPITYTPIWLSIPDKGTRKHCAIIDTFHEVVAWDFVARKLTGYRLKDVPVQMDLTDDEIIDMPYQEMLQNIDNWDNGGKELLSHYLESDLNLTKILGDKLLPPVYNKCLFLDWKFQSIAGSGNGTQWNAIISGFYGDDYLNSIKPDEKRRFKGAFSAAYAGMYTSWDKSGDEYAIVEFDILSLYPHMILLYGLTSRKDVDKALLQILAYLLDARIHNKNEAKRLEKLYKQASDILTQVQKNEINHYDGMQAVMKVLANSGYGYAGTSGIKFNDYHIASLVTAYGRAIFRHIYRLLAGLEDVTVVSCDTDGFKIRCRKKNIDPYLQYLNDNLPKNDRYAIKLKLEWTAKAIFVPPSDAQVNHILVMDGELGEVRSGLKKNYIVVMDSGKVKANGKYKKRDRSVFEKTFQPELVRLLAMDGELAARKYYLEIKKQMEEGTYPLEKVQITRKIKRGNADKTLILRGYGKTGDVITIHKSKIYSHYIGRKGQILKSAKWQNTIDPDDVCWEFYLMQLDNQFNEVMQFIDVKEKILV